MALQRTQRAPVFRCATAPWRDRRRGAAGIVFAPKMNAMNDRPSNVSLPGVAPRWIGLAAGLLVAVLDVVGARALGLAFELNGRAVTGWVWLYLAVSFGGLGFLVGWLLELRRRERAASAEVAAPGRGARSRPARASRRARSWRRSASSRPASRTRCATRSRSCARPSRTWRRTPAAPTTCAARARSCATRSIGWDG